MYRKAVPSHWTRSNGQGTFQRKKDKNGTHIYDTKREHCTIRYHVHAADSRRDGKVRYLRIGMCSYCDTTFC
jgi:hypothetical protein